MHRYAVLRHTDAPDDPSGCHYDLLLEDGDACRTWRLAEPPGIDHAVQTATPLPPHRLIWLVLFPLLVALIVVAVRSRSLSPAEPPPVQEVAP